MRKNVFVIRLSEWLVRLSLQRRRKQQNMVFVKMDGGRLLCKRTTKRIEKCSYKHDNTSTTPLKHVQINVWPKLNEHSQDKFNHHKLKSEVQGFF